MLLTYNFNKTTNKFLFFTCLTISIGAQASYSLVDLISITTKTHAQIEVNKYDKQSALQAIKSAKLSYYPTLDLSLIKVEASKSDINYFADDMVGTVSITQPLYAGGGLDANMDKVKADLKLQQALQQKKEFELKIAIVRLYTNFLLTYERLQNYIDNQAMYQKIHQSVKRKAKLGLIANAEFNLVEEKLQEFNYQLRSLTLKLDNILQQLSIQTGLSLVLSDLDLTTKQFNFTDINFTDFLERNYKMLKAKAQISSLIAQKQQITAKSSPKLNLRFEHQKGNFASPDFDTENRIFLELSGSFGFDSESNIKKLKLDLQSARLQLIVQEQEIRQEFMAKYLDYNNLKQQIVLLKNKIAQLIKIRQSSQRIFSVGKITWQDLLSSIDNLNAEKNKLVELDNQYLNLDYYFALTLGKL